MERIKLIGLENFDEIEKFDIQEMTKANYDKLSKEFEEITLVLHAKKYDKSGKKCKYALNAKIEKGEGVLSNAKYADWDLKKTLHKLFDKLDYGIKHKFKTV